MISIKKYFSPKRLISIINDLYWSRQIFSGISSKRKIETDAIRERVKRLPYLFSEIASLYPVNYDWGKESFLKSFKGSSNIKILDIGCGNDSPIFTKGILNDAYYVGVDIDDYNQNSSSVADEYILVSPENFASAIEKYNGEFDIIISSHNLEHCDDRARVLTAISKALKIGGRVYLSFPCFASVEFPKRDGTLNYYDDPTHKYTPPDFTDVIVDLAKGGLKVVYACTRYQSPVRWMIGATTESESNYQSALKAETWAFWGFETIIWAQKNNTSF